MPCFCEKVCFGLKRDVHETPVNIGFSARCNRVKKLLYDFESCAFNRALPPLRMRVRVVGRRGRINLFSRLTRGRISESGRQSCSSRPSTAGRACHVRSATHALTAGTAVSTQSVDMCKLADARHARVTVGECSSAARGFALGRRTRQSLHPGRGAGLFRVRR